MDRIPESGDGVRSFARMSSIVLLFILINMLPFVNAFAEEDENGVPVLKSDFQITESIIGNDYLSFDGVNDYVDFNSNLGIIQFPFELEFNFLLQTNDSDNILLAGHNNGNNYGVAIYLLGDNSIAVQYNDGPPDGSSTRKTWQTSSNVYNLNTDHNLIIINNGVNTMPNIILDGVNYNSTVTDGTKTTIDFNNASYTLGIQRVGSNYGSFDGDISYLRINVNNVDIHQYLFNEGAGTILNDSIGNVDGIINGATWQNNSVPGQDSYQVFENFRLAAVDTNFFSVLNNVIGFAGQAISYVEGVINFFTGDNFIVEYFQDNAFEIYDKWWFKPVRWLTE